MEKKALGLIETVGMAAALEAADAAVKSANITLIGYELSKGGGMVTIKIEGDVGAVSAAVQSGCAAAGMVNRVCSSKVIPRPHDEIKPMISSGETVGASRQAKKQIERAEPETPIPAEPVKTEDQLSEAPVETVDQLELEPEEVLPLQEELPAPEPLKKNGPTCNLCNDINCTRVKGDPKTKCIHYFNN